MTVIMDGELSNHKELCRCCLKPSRNQTPISERFRKIFHELTCLELIASDEYSNLVCEKCERKINDLSRYQIELVDNQTRLYQYVGAHAKRIVEDSVVVKVEFLDLRAHNLVENLSTLNAESVNAEMIDNSKGIGTVVEDDLGQFSLIYPSNIFVESENGSSESLFVDQEKCINKYERPFCKKCNKKFRTLESLRQHLKVVHHQQRLYACEICQSFQSDKKLDLLKHLKNHENENSLNDDCQGKRNQIFNCAHCEETFIDKERLVLHLETHIPSQYRQKLKCKFCDFEGCREATKEHELDHNRFELLKDLECLICLKKFINRKYALQHLKNVHGYNSSTCKACNRKLFRELDVLNHSKVCPAKNPVLNDRPSKFECDRCGKTFVDRSDIRTHLDIHIPEEHREIIKCYTCDFKADRNSLKFHTQTFHSEHLMPSLKCFFCLRTFDSKKSFISHLNTFHKENFHLTCHVCNKTFQNKKNYREHLSLHQKKTEKSISEEPSKIQVTGPKVRFICPYCSEYFTDVLSHVRDNHKEKTIYTCDICGDFVCKKKTMEGHVETHFKTRQKTHLCEFCGFNSLSHLGLKKHIEKNHSRLPFRKFPCECGKSFNSSRKLGNHRRLTHPPDNFKFPCKICKKTFNRQSTLMHHIGRLHVKKVPCDVCKKMIASGESMRTHMKTHKEPQFQCKFKRCSRKFHNKTIMNYHLENVHGPNKKLKCPNCDGIYRTKFSLNHHMKNQHKEKDVVCKVKGCNYRAVRKDYMKKHYRSLEVHKHLDEQTRQKLLDCLSKKRS